MSEENKQRLGELLRFGVVGVTAVLIQYGVYLALMPLLQHLLTGIGDHPLATLANTVAYLVSFVFNFIASTRYTFRVKANAKRGAGFAFSHLINYSLQTLFLNLLVGLGMARQTAMLPTLCLSVPINFLLVRYFLKK